MATHEIPSVRALFDQALADNREFGRRLSATRDAVEAVKILHGDKLESEEAVADFVAVMTTDPVMEPVTSLP